jgi:hypothetical protein
VSKVVALVWRSRSAAIASSQWFLLILFRNDPSNAKGVCLNPLRSSRPQSELTVTFWVFQKIEAVRISTPITTVCVYVFDQLIGEYYGVKPISQT